MIRKILAVVSGIALSMALLMSIEALGHAVYPAPAGLDPSDLDTFRDYVMSLPAGALFFVLAGWTVATFGGGLLTGFLAREQNFAYIIGALFTIASVVNLIMIPHPVWFAASGFAAIVAMTFLAKTVVAHLLQKR